MMDFALNMMDFVFKMTNFNANIQVERYRSGNITCVFTFKIKILQYKMKILQYKMKILQHKMKIFRLKNDDFLGDQDGGSLITVILQYKTTRKSASFKRTSASSNQLHTDSHHHNMIFGEFSERMPVVTG